MKGTCKICGCTENSACVEVDNGPCWWVDDSEELCSHCVIEEIKNSPFIERKKDRVDMNSFLRSVSYLQENNIDLDLFSNDFVFNDSDYLYNPEEKESKSKLAIDKLFLDNQLKIYNLEDKDYEFRCKIVENEKSLLGQSKDATLFSRTYLKQQRKAKHIYDSFLKNIFIENTFVYILESNPLVIQSAISYFQYKHVHFIHGFALIIPSMTISLNGINNKTDFLYSFACRLNLPVRKKDCSYLGNNIYNLIKTKPQVVIIEDFHLFIKSNYRFNYLFYQ